MRIVVILPRHMHFGPRYATAIDLCARDFIAHSAYSASTVVLGEPVDEPFEGIQFKPIAARSKTERSKLFVQAALAEKPDLVVVHQYLPTAADIARALSPVPVILHRHNVVKPLNWLQRWRHGRMYARFARTIWVSNFARQAYEAQFPQFAGAAVTVHNGLDLDAWHPREAREQTILCVGRATPEKGILQAAQGITAALEGHPGWRARFILSRLDRADDYFAAIKAALQPLGNRAEVLTDQKYDTVQAAYEVAAIAIVPSIFPEPFGRTSVEAFAGGAALIVSRTGALQEVAGDAAITLDEVTPASIASALRKLIADAPMRAELAAKGAARARNSFEIRALARRLDGIYKEAAGRTDLAAHETAISQ